MCVLLVVHTGSSTVEKEGKPLDISKPPNHNHHQEYQGGGEGEEKYEEEEKEKTPHGTVVTGRTEKDRSPLPPARLLPDPSCIYCNPNRPRVTSMDCLVEEEGEETRTLLQILEFPSRVFATRQPVDLDRSYPKSKRTILRDVLRTDRNIHYFR